METRITAIHILPTPTTRKHRLMSTVQSCFAFGLWLDQVGVSGGQKLIAGRLLVGGCPKHWPSVQVLRTPYEKCQGLLDIDVSKSAKQSSSGMPVGFTVIQ
jgi:hypothetical protein